MYDDLLEKTEHEYERFYMYIKLISRCELFTRAYELAVKKAVYERLTADIKAGELDRDTEDVLMREEDMLDWIYLKAGSRAVMQNGNITDKSWGVMRASLKF